MHCPLCGAVIDRSKGWYWRPNVTGGPPVVWWCSATCFDTMAARERFESHLQECAKIVSKWPAWKKDMLGPAQPDAGVENSPVEKGERQ